MTFRRFSPWRRRSSFRGASRPFARRGFSRFNRRPGFARKKYDMITLFDSISTNNGQGGCTWGTASPCGFTTGDCAPSVENPSAGCCNTIITFELMSQATLQSFFQDKVTIVRLFGELYYQDVVNLPIGGQRCLPQTDPSPTYVDPEQYALRYALAIEWGLRKDSAADDPSDTDLISPSDMFDRTETYWYWRRNRLWVPRLWRTHGDVRAGSAFAVCGNTSGGAVNIVPPIASGSQPTYNIDTSVSTSCETQDIANTGGEGCASQYNEFHYQEPPLLHWRFNMRRHVLMRRDDRLHLQCAVNHPARPGWSAGYNCDSTFLNEGWTSNVKVRVDAVVQLN